MCVSSVTPQEKRAWSSKCFARVSVWVPSWSIWCCFFNACLGRLSQTRTNSAFLAWYFSQLHLQRKKERFKSLLQYELRVRVKCTVLVHGIWSFTFLCKFTFCKKILRQSLSQYLLSNNFSGNQHINNAPSQQRCSKRSRRS